MKGQNLRLFIGDQSKPIAKAQECSIHVAAQTENDSSKDSVNDFDEIEVVGKAWDASATCDFLTTDAGGAMTAADVIALVGQKVVLKFSPASGDNNRTAGVAILSGSAYITDMSITAANKQKVQAQIQFSGSGPLS